MRDTSLFSEKVNIGTRRRHQREVWLQILLPLLFGVVLGGLALFTLFRASSGNVTRGAELATIFLAIPMLIIGVIFIVAIVGLIVALGIAMKWIPTKTIYAHQLMDRVNSVAQRGADLVARPVVAFDSWSNAIGGMLKRLR